MKVVLRRSGATLVEYVEPALSLFDRMKGLLGRQSLGPNKAIYLSPCSAVHTFFMRFKLDLVFLDKNLVVTRVVSGASPNRIVAGGRGARSVLEMESGWLTPGAVRVGDTLEVV